MCTKAEVKEAVDEALEKAHKDFWVDPETHFIHHQSVERWLKLSGMVEKSFVKTFITGLVIGLLGMFWLGFAAYLKLKG